MAVPFKGKIFYVIGDLVQCSAVRSRMRTITSSRWISGPEKMLRRYMTVLRKVNMTESGLSRKFIMQIRLSDEARRWARHGPDYELRFPTSSGLETCRINRTPI